MRTVFHFLLNDGATASSNRPVISDEKENFVYRLICAYLPNIEFVVLIVYLFYFIFFKTYF